MISSIIGFILGGIFCHHIFDQTYAQTITVYAVGVTLAAIYFDIQRKRERK
jgi:hypothetical protein